MISVKKDGSQLDYLILEFAKDKINNKIKSITYFDNIYYDKIKNTISFCKNKSINVFHIKDFDSFINKNGLIADKS